MSRSAVLLTLSVCDPKTVVLQKEMNGQDPMADGERQHPSTRLAPPVTACPAPAARFVCATQAVAYLLYSTAVLTKYRSDCRVTCQLLPALFSLMFQGACLR